MPPVLQFFEIDESDFHHRYDKQIKLFEKLTRHNHRFPSPQLNFTRVCTYIIIIPERIDISKGKGCDVDISHDQ